MLGDGADVVCLTEAYRDFFGSEGYTIEAQPAASDLDGQRKVMLWSRNPWHGADGEGPDGLPAGRFVSGRTKTPAGDITVIGVCIPYRWAGVRYVQIKERLWEVHLRYLSVLDGFLSTDPKRMVVLGDFNQRIPRKYQPQRVYEALDKILLRRFNIATAGVIGDIGRQAIDHICHSRDLAVQHVKGLSNIGPDGREISDHFGLQVSLTLDSAAPR